MPLLLPFGSFSDHYSGVWGPICAPKCTIWPRAVYKQATPMKHSTVTVASDAHDRGPTSKPKALTVPPRRTQVVAPPAALRKGPAKWGGRPVSRRRANHRESPRQTKRTGGDAKGECELNPHKCKDKCELKRRSEQRDQAALNNV